MLKVLGLQFAEKRITKKFEKFSKQLFCRPSANGRLSVFWNNPKFGRFPDYWNMNPEQKIQQNTRHNLYGYEKKIFDNLLERNLIEKFKSAWIIRSIRQLYRENYMGWNIRSFPFLTTHWPSTSQVYLNK